MQLLYPLEFRNSLEVKLDSAHLGGEHHDEWCDIYKLDDLSQLDQLNLLISLGDFFKFMPVLSSTPKGHIKKDILKHEIKDSVTFFGGSFFPFHPGHMACLELCPEENIVIVPDCNPHKELKEKMNPYDDFMHLCLTLKDTPYSVYPGFFGRNKPNPTSNWLPKVKIAQKNFLMGDDSFMNILKWHEPEVLLNALTKIYVAPRDFETSDYAPQIEKVKAINPKLEIIILPDHPYRSLSSSKIRARQD
nr:cytidylyltransferase [Bacteriovorax sp. HI3]